MALSRKWKQYKVDTKIINQINQTHPCHRALFSTHTLWTILLLVSNAQNTGRLPCRTICKRCTVINKISSISSSHSLSRHNMIPPGRRLPSLQRLPDSWWRLKTNPEVPILVMDADIPKICST